MRGMTKDRRQSELAKIHIGKKQLFDDGGDYQDMLQSVAGVRSAAQVGPEAEPAGSASGDGAPDQEDPGHAGRGWPA